MINMKIKLLTAALLSLGAAFSLHAQTVGLGDIIVGFRGNSTTTNNLEVKAGSVSALTAFSSETLIGNFNTQLTSMVSGAGAGWAANTSAGAGQNGAFWGAAGTQGSTQVYAGVIWDKTTPVALGSGSNSLNGTNWNGLATVGTANTKIGNLNTGFNSGSATSTGDGLSKTITAANANSWSGNGANTGSTAFGQFSPNNNGFTGVIGNNIAAGPAVIHRGPPQSLWPAAKS